MKGGRLSKVRTDPRAVGLKRSVHAAQATTRLTKKYPGCKQSRTDFAQSIGKPSLVVQSGAAHSFSHRQTLGRWAKISAKIVTDKQIYVFIWKTQRLHSKPGSFFQNIRDISIIALQTIFSRNIPDISTTTFPEIFQPEIFKIFRGIFRENGPRNIRNIATIPGPLSRNI